MPKAGVILSQPWRAVPVKLEILCMVGSGGGGGGSAAVWAAVGLIGTGPRRIEPGYQGKQEEQETARRKQKKKLKKREVSRTGRQNAAEGGNRPGDRDRKGISG
jgi:hypothetical protein